MTNEPPYRVSLTRISSNVKTGPIPVSTTDRSTCPPSCAMFNECYAKFGHLSIHWRKLNDGERGTNWTTFCEQVRSLPRKGLWRYAQAGDLPGDGERVDSEALQELVRANTGKRGFTYTHYPLSADNLQLIEGATRSGFTINVSCDSLTLSDRAADITDLPQAVVLPSTITAHAVYTPAGRKVVVCPATYRDDMNCAVCGICYEARSDRAPIGFPAHGVKKKVIDVRLVT